MNKKTPKPSVELAPQAETAENADAQTVERDNDAQTADAENNENDAIIERALPAEDVLYYAPITRIDREKREVIGTATAEVKDSFGTIIGYDASKDAFARWAGNIREMHDPKKAVGRALEVTPDDAGRRIVVRAQISKGAQDTWEKLLDGTLTGFSIGGKNGKWTQRIVDGEKVPFLERYDQAELSLVDNPSCPSSRDVAIVRADGLASEVLATEDEVATETSAIATRQDNSVERAGARLSKETQAAMHTARDHAMNAAKSSMDTCGCDDCTTMLNKVNETDDGDGDNVLAQPAARAAIADIVRGVLADALRDQIAPTMSRVNALLARDASRSEAPDFTRNFTSLTERNDALASQLTTLQALVEKIADQPLDGGPVLHGAAMDKRLATQSGVMRSADDSEIMRRALELGFAPPSDAQSQVRAAAAVLNAQRH